MVWKWEIGISLETTNVVYSVSQLKGAETNLYTFKYWLFSESIQICFRTLYSYFQPGSYGVRVFNTPQLTEYKMYNHSCDQMDRKEGQEGIPLCKLYCYIRLC